MLQQHLKDLTVESQGQSGVDFLEAIAKFLNKIILRGDIPVEVQPSFYGALLLALSKPEGGVRPIAVVNTLRRLVSKTIMQKIVKFFISLIQTSLTWSRHSLLESPIHQSTIETFLSHKLEDLERMTERLMEIDPHDALFLLKQFFNSKINLLIGLKQLCL